MEQFYEAAVNVIEMVPVFMTYCPKSQPVILNDEHTEYGWFSLDDTLERAEIGGQRLFYQYLWGNFVNRTPSILLKINTFNK